MIGCTWKLNIAHHIDFPYLSIHTHTDTHTHTHTDTHTHTHTPVLKIRQFPQEMADSPTCHGTVSAAGSAVHGR